MNYMAKAFIFSFVLLGATAVIAESRTNDIDEYSAVSEKLNQKLGDLKNVIIRKSSVSGLYEVSVNSGEYILYTDKNVERLIFGALVNADTLVNETEVYRAEIAAKLLVDTASSTKVNLDGLLKSSSTPQPASNLVTTPLGADAGDAVKAPSTVTPPKDVRSPEKIMSDMLVSVSGMIPDEWVTVFQPNGAAKKVLTVFTDPTCPYCRKLHAEIPKLQAAGVKVRYMMYPRHGVDSPAAKQLGDAWCASDRAQAIDLVFSGKSVAARDPECAPPVKEQFGIGNELQITGTPAILVDDGRMLSGYMSAEELLNKLGVVN